MATIGFVFVAAAVILSAGAPYANAQEIFQTSNGFAIESHPVKNLTCGQLTEQLNAIDETGYRSGGPEPTDDADRALYDYELKLSVEFFWRCATRVDGQVQNDAFRSGFAEQSN